MISLLKSVYVANYVYWNANVESPLYLWNQDNLIMTSNLLSVFLPLLYWEIVRLCLLGRPD